MSRAWYGHDSGLSARMFLVMALLAVVYLFFIAILLMAGFDFVFVGLIAAVLLGVQYFFSDKLALASIGAREVSPQQAPDLHVMIERLAQLADMPKPKVAIAQSRVPNAFATGRNPKNSVVCVTTGILQQLERPELEAVLAHELTHIKNRDVMVITLASFFATVAMFLMRFMPFAGVGGGRGRDRGGGAGAFMLVFLASLLVWVISFLLIRLLSRYREYAADRGGAILIGSPSRLASALSAISGSMRRIPNRDLREVEGLNAFFFVPALTGESLMELVSTHPPVEKRIERLMAMERAMEGR